MVNKHKQIKNDFQDLQREQQGTQYFNWKKIQKFVKNKKRRKTEKDLQHFQEMQFSDDEN